MGLARQKRLGAFYTPEPIARALVRWAVNAPTDTVLDPGAGGGVFLRCAVEHLRELGGCTGPQVVGVEVDRESHEALIASLNATDAGGTVACVFHGSFFDQSPLTLGRFSAVVGNPPFIRYHNFKGRERDSALLRAREAGVELSQMSSAWAPFLVHATQFVEPGGRLAVVAPVEALHARYALPVLKLLGASFRTLDVVAFTRSSLFPELEQRAIVLLCEGRGERGGQVRLHCLDGAESLNSDLRDVTDGRHGVDVDVDAVADGTVRLAEYYLANEARALYRELRSEAGVVPLSKSLDIDIGYVTGGSDFFHFSKSTADGLGIPSSWLAPTLRRGGLARGLRFTKVDWRSLRDSDYSAMLLSPPRHRRRTPIRVEQYLSTDDAMVVSSGYKCGDRDPWWRVPLGRKPEGFLIYGSGRRARLCENTARVWASNAVHVLWRKAGVHTPLRYFVAAWMSSLSQLSIELEGHALGAGLLKLDVRGAERTSIVAPEPGNRLLTVESAKHLDKLVRSGRWQDAQESVDAVLLKSYLGLSPDRVMLLRSAISRLNSIRHLHAVETEGGAELPDHGAVGESVARP